MPLDLRQPCSGRILLVIHWFLTEPIDAPRSIPTTIRMLNLQVFELAVYELSFLNSAISGL